LNAILAVAPYLTLCLGHFYFTKLLIPTLLAGAKTSPDGKARIVNTSSSGHMFSDALDFNTFKEGPARVKKGTNGLYAQSKLVRFLSPILKWYSRRSQGNIHVSNEFAKRYGNQGIVSTSLNPGNIKSDLQRHLSSVQSFLLVNTSHHTLIPSLTNCTLGYYPIFNSVWRLDAIVGWHITSRSRVEREGKFFNVKNKLGV
jgi:retinol dehydrogenase 12